MGDYELIDHTADVGIRVRAKSLGELFEKAAYAMFDILADLNLVAEREAIHLRLEALTVEDLFVKWLRELLYRYETDEVIFKSFHVKNIDENSMEAEAGGERLDLNRHPVNTEIKLVTYHQLEVRRDSQGWKAQVIFDV